MSWRIPGKNFVVEVEGKKITCKPLPESKRRELAMYLTSQKDNKPEDVADTFLIKISELIESVEGYSGTIIELLESQTAPFVLKIFNEIMSGNTLSEEEVKN